MPSSLPFPSFRIAVSLGIERRDEDSSDFSSKVATLKPGQDVRMNFLLTYCVPDAVGTSSHDL